MPFDGGVMEPVQRAAQPRLLSLRVGMPDGGVLWPSVRVGARIIDALAAYGLPVKVTELHRGRYSYCRAVISASWVDDLPPPSAGEKEALAALGADDGRSRLLCQLIMTRDLNGLEFELPWDALVPQTYWVAG
jgi:ferredoxin